MKKIIAYSGGLESTISLLIAINNFGKDNIIPVYIEVRGTPSKEKEIECITKVCRGIRTEIKFLNLKPLFINADEYEITQKTRAGIFMVDILPSIARDKDVDTIFWGAERYNREGFFIHNFKDLDPLILDKINIEYKKRDYPFIADSLVKDTEKRYIVSAFLDIYNNFGLEGRTSISPIFNTWSCTFGGSQECGNCTKCFEKYYALRVAGFNRDEVLSRFTNNPLQSDYAKRLPKNINKLKEIQSEKRFAPEYENILLYEIQQLSDKLNFVMKEEG